MNIDISKYVELLKSYMSLLVPALIALLGIVFLVPTHLMSSNLRSTMEKESVSLGKRVKSLIGGAVPSSQWEVERAYQQQHSEDANAIYHLARETTLRRLLSYTIFPKPKDNSVMIFPDFGHKYCASIRKLINSVHGGSCPSRSELQSATQSWGPRSYRDRGSASNVRDKIEDSLCRAKAEEHCVYADAAYLSGYGFWQEYDHSEIGSTDDAIRACWYSQLAYWVIEDIFATVEVMNKGSETVLTSAVKRLGSVSFVRSGINWKYPVPTKKTTKSDLKSMPRYVVSSKDMLVRSYTKRVCNDVYDVVHFKVAVVLNSESVLEFMKELCSSKSHEFAGWDGNGPVEHFEHNQITVLEYKLAPVDSLANEHKLYRYGEDAVVELELTCEYLLDKVAYDSVKPNAVKAEVSKKKSSGK